MTRRIVAVSIPLVVLGSIVISALAAGKPAEIAFAAGGTASAAVGALLWYRGANRAMTWLFLFSGIADAFFLPVESIAGATDPDTWLARWSAWTFQVSLGIAVGFFLILQLFPTGTTVSRRWRGLVVATLAIGLLQMLVAAFGNTVEFRSNFPGVGHPLTVLPPSITNALDNLAGFGTLVIFVGSALAMIVRYRRSHGEERLQMKWFTLASAIAAAGFGVGFVVFPNDPVYAFVALTPLIPLAAGVAILKYRLYEIDVIISKTIVYGALAAFISGVYVLVVVGVGSLLGSRQNVALSIAATAAVAIGFQPVRQKVQSYANRLVYGVRSTPYEVMAGFSERVSETLSTDEVLPRMAEVAGRGVGAVESSVGVFLPDGAERVILWEQDGISAPSDVRSSYAIAHQGTKVGRITIVKPRDEPLSPAEDRLLSDLTSQAGLALHNVRLSAELTERLRLLDEQAAKIRDSRERLVTARDVQRRGLQRDLHLGPESKLVAMAHRLDQLSRSPDPCPDDLEPLIEEANVTLEDLRDLARGIFPPLLAEKGVIAALDAHIRKVGVSAKIVADEAIRTERYDADTEAALYFISLQALQNVTRHAPGASAEVHLDRTDDRLRLVISDDGPGFDVEQTHRGMGLEITQDRVDALEGELRFTSAIGRGTTIIVSLPIRDRVPVSSAEHRMETQVDSR
jgi:signal transduction histidine kinase